MRSEPNSLCPIHRAVSSRDDRRVNLTASARISQHFKPLAILSSGDDKLAFRMRIRVLERHLYRQPVRQPLRIDLSLRGSRLD